MCYSLVARSQSQPNWMYYLEYKDLLLMKSWWQNCIYWSNQPSHLKLHNSCVARNLKIFAMAQKSRKAFIACTNNGCTHNQIKTTTLNRRWNSNRNSERHKSAHNKHKYKITDVNGTIEVNAMQKKKMLKRHAPSKSGSFKIRCTQTSNRYFDPIRS